MVRPRPRLLYAPSVPVMASLSQPLIDSLSRGNRGVNGALNSKSSRNGPRQSKAQHRHYRYGQPLGLLPIHVPFSDIYTGGGIIGCTSAYFVTRHPSFNPALHTVTILEATGIASGASGKAGGLLALWAYPSSIVPLSYRLHAELAAEHNGEKRW